MEHTLGFPTSRGYERHPHSHTDLQTAWGLSLDQCLTPPLACFLPRAQNSDLTPASHFTLFGCAVLSSGKLLSQLYDAEIIWKSWRICLTRNARRSSWSLAVFSIPDSVFRISNSWLLLAPGCVGSLLRIPWSVVCAPRNPQHLPYVSAYVAGAICEPDQDAGATPTGRPHRGESHNETSFCFCLCLCSRLWRRRWQLAVPLIRGSSRVHWEK